MRHKLGPGWERRKWEPAKGMRIRYRRDIGSAYPEKRDPLMVAVILDILADGSLHIERDRGKRRNTHLRPATWMVDWEPLPVVEAPPPIAQLPLPAAISEADIRRIVREELRAILAP
jgi:hypothetical protein